MIKKIFLQNWKTHLDTELEFSKGTNVIVGKMGSGKSLPFSEKVFAKLGNWKKVQIGEIVEESLKRSEKIMSDSDGKVFTTENPLGIKVQSVNPKTQKIEIREVSGFIKHLSPKTLLHIKTRQGKEIRLTKDHSLISTNEQGAISSVKCDELKPGGYVVCPSKIYVPEKCEEIDLVGYLPDFRKTTNINAGLELMRNGKSATVSAQIVGATKYTLANWMDRKVQIENNFLLGKSLMQLMPEKIAVTEEFAKIAGAYVSEGHSNLSDSSSGYEIKITNNDREFVDEIQRCWDKTFSHISQKYERNDIKISSKVACVLFSRMFGDKSGVKMIPWQMFSWPERAISAFIGAYFEGDGWIMPEKAELACCSKSKQLIEQMQTLLLLFGINSRMRKIMRHDFSYHELKILPKHILLFANNIKFLSRLKQKKLEEAARVLKNRKRWEGIDVIPPIGKLLSELSKQNTLYTKKNMALRKIASQLRVYRLYEKMGREKLRRTLEKIYLEKGAKTSAFVTLEKIANNELIFDEIISIEEIPADSEYVYDLSVEEAENFVAGTGNILAHNSSVLDAISYALYGTFPAQAARKVSLEEIIMERPMKQERATVKLELDYAGKEYTIERVVKRSGLNEAYLRHGGRIISGPRPTDVNEKVAEVLEVGYDLFSRAVYSEQNQIDYFLRLSPSQRKEKFDELLGLDRYEVVRQNAGTLSNRLKKTAEDRKAFLEEQKKKFDARQLEEYSKRVGVKRKGLAEKKSAVEGLAKEINEKEKELAGLEKGEKEHMALKEAHIKARSRAEALAEQLSKAREKLGGKNRKRVEAELAGCEKAFTGLEAERKEMKKGMEEAEKTLSGQREEAAVLRSVMEQNSKSLKNAKSLEGTCPVCRRPLEKHDREKLEKELGQEGIKVGKEIEKVAAEMKKSSAEVESAKKKIEECEKGREKSMREIEGLKRLAEAFEDAAEKEKQKGTAEEETAKALKAVEKYGFEEKELVALRKMVAELRERSARLAAERRADEELLKELEAGIERMKEAREGIEKLGKQLKGLSTAQEKLAVFTSALKATQAELRNTMIETINEAMEEVWGKIYPYEDLTSVKIGVQEGSYEVMVRQRSGAWTRVEGILSGGERSSAALAMRIAISLVLTQNLGWIILDEPTHNLDANAVRELSEVMRNSLPELIDQVFIITHDKEMENAASGKLYVLEREKENDGATRIAGG